MTQRPFWHNYHKQNYKKNKKTYTKTQLSKVDNDAHIIYTKPQLTFKVRYVKFTHNCKCFVYKSWFIDDITLNYECTTVFEPLCFVHGVILFHSIFWCWEWQWNPTWEGVPEAGVKLQITFHASVAEMLKTHPSTLVNITTAFWQLWLCTTAFTDLTTLLVHIYNFFSVEKAWGTVLNS